MMSLMFFASEVAFASPLNSKTIMHDYSYLKIDEASTLLRAIVDGDQKTRKAKVFCGINEAHASQMLNRIHALYEDHAQMVSEAYLNNKLTPESVKSWNETCKSSCHCGFYSRVIELVGDKLAKADGPAAAQIQAQASTQNSQDTLKCAEDSRWFCGSRLYRYLKK